MEMTSAIEKLQQLLFELAGVSAEDSLPLFAMVHVVNLNQNQTYIGIGSISRKLAYIQDGIIRGYTIKENGDDATLFLRSEGQFIASHEGIIFKQPSRFIYHALAPTTLMEIDYDVLEEILKTHPVYEPLRNFFLMRMLGEALAHIETFVTQSPEERYRALVATQQALVNRVPDKYIASMLGITPVSLSRIRKRMHKRDK
ncbi:Crp/Fnr family transcriptional regulator [Pedobacter sp. KLB.chiD]|uniref:Crp/Fnr family transcriptional regulator n=1 Tax=Pedobacter sp. KLB.chiD TaxID=3387402 RepID=UPI003999BE9C